MSLSKTITRYVRHRTELAGPSAYASPGIALSKHGTASASATSPRDTRANGCRSSLPIPACDIPAPQSRTASSYAAVRDQKRTFAFRRSRHEAFHTICVVDYRVRVECLRPTTVVNVPPAAAPVPGPAGAPGAAGAPGMTGEQSATGAQGKTGGGMAIVVPPPSEQK